MDRLSPETRALVERARDGERLDGERREALRQRASTALGVPPLQAPRSMASASWALRGLSALGVAGTALLVLARLHGRPILMATEVPVATACEGIPLAVAAPHVVELPPATPAPSTSPTSPRPRPAREVADGLEQGHQRSAARSEDALAAEARLLGAVQSALDSGDGARALALLDEHDGRFPAGVLNPESGALRVQALCAAGRVEEARAAAARLRASPAAARRFPSASCVEHSE